MTQYGCYGCYGSYGSYGCHAMGMGCKANDGSLKRITLHLSELFASFCEVGKDRPKQ